MTFSSKVKEEISTLECNRLEYLSELSGIIRTSADIKIYSIKLQTENKFVANRIFGLFNVLYGLKVNISARKNYNFKKQQIYILEQKQEIVKVLKDLGIVNEKNEFLMIPSESIISDEELKNAFLRGVFLVCGSINDPKKSRYHLEFLINDEKYAIFLNNFLKEKDLNSKILHRKKGYMVYIKESEKISDFLKLIKAYNAVMYYEDIRIYRDHVNMTNRLNNCEQANVEKTFITSNKHIQDIKILEENDQLEFIDERLKEVAIFRKKYPESSLKELSDIITKETNKKVSKSSLNHRLRKIKEIADKFRK
ncbi:MAG TPA: DNA-binding protein WhiA [Bacilli bacterium]|nr:DNA-binding protein WhiA [Bacilli bacterium]